MSAALTEADMQRLPGIGNNRYNQALERKWQRILEGVNGRGRRRLLAILLENQANSVKSTLTEQTKSGDVGSFLKFVFPIIRRVFPNLISNDIVSVQPMTAPVGGIFFRRARYGDTKGSVTAGEELLVNFSRNYSGQFVDGEAVGGEDGTTTTFSTLSKWRPILPESLEIFITDAGGTKAQMAHDDGSGALVSDDAEFDTGTVNYLTGEVVMEFNTAPDADDVLTLEYNYNNELNSRIPSIEFDITLQEVRAESRKLKSLWSAEAADDIRALHGLELEGEVASELSAEIGLEVDRSNIEDIRSGVDTVATTTFDAAVPATIPDLDHFKNIIVALNRASNVVHRRTLRGPANWMVTSPDVMSILDSLPFFAATDPSENVFTGGIIKVGTIQNKWTVYKDPFFTTDEILVGRQGTSFLDTGFVWAPYIPLQVTPSFLDPNDLSFRKAVRTRFASALVRSEFFALVTVDNLPT